MPLRLYHVSTFALSMLLFAVLAGSPSFSAEVEIPDLSRVARSAKLIRSGIGVTRKNTKIECLIHPQELDHTSAQKRVLLVGGLDGSAESTNGVLQLLDAFYRTQHKTYPDVLVSAVPLANPDGLRFQKAPANASNGRPLQGYPPQGAAYNSPTNPEAAYLWRWIGMHAPDVVVVVEFGESLKQPAWSVAAGDLKLSKAIGAEVGVPDGHVVQALHKGKPSNTGSIAAVRLRIPAGPVSSKWLNRLLAVMKNQSASGARLELIQRLNRTPIQVAKQLAARYGHELNSVAYIPALALVARIQLGELTGETHHLIDVEGIVKPYVDGRKTLGGRVSGSNLSGHLIFGVLAEKTKNKRYVELAQAAADLGFEADGSMKPAMPGHVEMSDSVFMGCPILAQVGKLAVKGDKYWAMSARHMRFMLKLNLRADGLHRHSPLDQTAWGRGNGFPALGLAWTLSEFPTDHPDFDGVRQAFRNHIQALVQHQDPTGAWHQVIDRVESYRELTSTCMITFAIVRGIRKGWLDEKTYRPVVVNAWRAIRTRIAADGTLVDVCTGTGKQNSLRAYYDRTAILGADARGGAMSLMVTTELATWLRESKRTLD